MAHDPLGPVGGVSLLAGAVLLALGLFVPSIAILLCVQTLVAYFYAAAPATRGPIRNGGDDTLLYSVLALYFAVVEPRAWTR